MVTAATWLMLVVCIAGAVVAAVAQRNSVRSTDARSFRTTSDDVTASMASALRRNTDFMSSLATTVSIQPQMTNARFAQWIAGTDAFGRHAGGIGYAFIAHVPASQLRAFARRQLADPPPMAAPGQRRFAVVPAGRRADYCFPRLNVSLAPTNAPLGLDVCRTASPGYTSKSGREVFDTAAETGQTTVVALDVAHGLTGIVTPVYRGGPAPATVPARRAAVLGWAVGTFDGPAILAAAGGVRPGLRVEISHRNAGAAPLVVAAAGTAKDSSQARVTPVDADGAWSIRVTGAVVRSGLSATAQFWIVLLVGLGISGLLFGFVQVLGRSRVRALRLVARKTAELRHLALHDGLTGLPNRALILDRAEQALARARRHSSEVAVMFLDLDGFKPVNDSLGHAAGDELLRAVSARLSGLLRDSDTVGRLGGDEFVVVVEGDSLDAGPEVIAERIRAVLAEPFLLGDPTALTSVQIRASIGIAVGLRAHAEDLLRDADVALYEAKEYGKDRFVLFAPEMQTVIEQRLDLERDLANAIEGDELFLAYQPTFDLATNTINGVEALLRWKHPTRGLIMPDDFIPAAEASGLIVTIGRWVLDQACHQAVTWQRGDHPLSVSVNVSGRQLDTDTDFIDQVRTALSASGLRPELLTLEITETVLMRDAQASALDLHALKALGVRIAIDDFGTGYSSLGYLRQFPVDALKIDRSFIGDIADNPESSALIHTLVQLGKSLGIETLAEGIEESSQLDQLQREACDSGQGYLFARPLTPEAVGQLLAAAGPGGAAASRR